METLLPPDWSKPRGHAHGMVAEGKLVFVAGQIGCNAEEKIETDDFVAQARIALQNVCAVLAEAGAGPTEVTRMTWYVTDMAEYLARRRELGEVYRAVMGRNYPAMTLVEIKSLVEPRAHLEIEATAVVPHDATT